MNKTQWSFAVMGLLLFLNLGAEVSLVEIKSINPNIRYVSSKRSGGYYLCAKAARCLGEVQKELSARGYCLMVDEAYIPYSEQKNAVEQDCACKPCKEECLRHSCGNAVDVCIALKDGTALPVPTDFDVFTPEARPDYMNLGAEVIEYREILCDAMERHGFKASSNLWYHFECTECDACEYLDISLG